MLEGSTVIPLACLQALDRKLAFTTWRIGASTNSLFIMLTCIDTSMKPVSALNLPVHNQHLQSSKRLAEGNCEISNSINIICMPHSLLSAHKKVTKCGSVSICHRDSVSQIGVQRNTITFADFCLLSSITLCVDYSLESIQ
jgi:hypothetical protein